MPLVSYINYLCKITHVKNSVVTFPLLNIWVLNPSGQVVHHHELQEAGVDKAHADRVPEVHGSQVWHNLWHCYPTRFVDKLCFTGRFDLNPLEVVKKLSMVVTPSITRAGTAFHSIQNVTKDEVTRIIPKVCSLVKFHLDNENYSTFCLTWDKNCGPVKGLVSSKVQFHLQTTKVA